MNREPQPIMPEIPRSIARNDRDDARFHHPDVPLPPASDLILTPALTATAMGHPLDLSLYKAGRSLSGPMRIAFDLDDTLFAISHRHPEEWDIAAMGRRAEPMFNDDRWPVSPWRWLRHRWRLPRYFLLSTRDRPYLRNPYVLIAPRPGVLALLIGLKEAGHELVLITTCRRARLEWLHARLRVLNGLFKWIIDGDLIADFLIRLQRPDTSEMAGRGMDPESRRLHAEHPARLTLKTPGLSACLTDGSPYDILVDDSPELARLFAGTPLARRLATVDDPAPRSTVAVRMLTAIAEATGRPVPAITPPADLSGYHLTVLEDPLYFPYLHQSTELRLN